MAPIRNSLFDRDTPLQTLGQYRSWKLRNHDVPIDMVWTSLASSENPVAHRVLPHGEPSIAILRNRDARGEITNIRLIVCGPNAGAHLYTPEPGEELIAVRAKPEISARVFAIAPADFLNHSNGLRLAPLAVQNACAPALRAAETFNAQIVALLLAQAVLKYFEVPQNPHTPESFGAEMLRASNGAISTCAIARELSVSERHFRRRFRDHLGVSPKIYARQLRLTYAAVSAEKTKRPDWAQIAQLAGFHDQPHMINEFRTMIGMSPKALHHERRELSDFYNQ